MNRETRRNLALSACVALAAGVALSGCSIVSSDGQLVYQDRKEAAAEHEKGLPDWIPADAKDIKLSYPSDGDGHLVVFRSETGVPASKACTAEPDGPLEPSISSPWWPATPPSADRRACGDSEVASADGEWYAWVRD